MTSDGITTTGAGKSVRLEALKEPQRTLVQQATAQETWLIDGPQDADTTLVLAHGAGGGMDTAFLQALATDLASEGVRIVRFEFPYMWRRRQDANSSRRPPDRQPVLEASWEQVVLQLHAAQPEQRIFIGGKSMGGRIASMVADDFHDAGWIDGLVCLGYPFHPPGRPERLRTAHLEPLATPTLIVQGSRDAFGNADEVAEYPLSSSIQLVWAPDGDHSLKPRKRSGRTEQDNLRLAQDAILAFLRETA